MAEHPAGLHTKTLREEREEFRAVLQSGLLGKGPNMQNFLTFVGEKYFAGNAEDVKEYSIAVEALNRPPTFDPKSDTIVRVTAYSLRKRLEQYYQQEGATHSVQMQLPSGRYVLQFIHKEEEPSFGLNSQHDEIPESRIPSGARPTLAGRFRWAVAGVVFVACFATAGVYLSKHWSVLSAAHKTAPGPALTAPPSGPLRLLTGDSPKPYVDVAGQIWLPNQYCKGGTSFVHADHTVKGTDDQGVFQQGRKGIFRCAIPVKQGAYQIELFFADTANDKVNGQNTTFAINSGPPVGIDVVDQAGDNDVATANLFAGVHPLADGTIHIDILNDLGFLNAIEILPAPSDDPLPIRMTAGSEVVYDAEGKTWGPERFFMGGRRTPQPGNPPKDLNARIFATERYGHFRYLLPVVPQQEYSVKLYLAEGWFGAKNNGPGGVASRIFDVSCNGTVLLKDFDILKDHPDGIATPTFHHLKPTAQGLLELNFTPVVNYPTINAIEVVPEG
jgi:hypothetical protein